MKHYRFAQNVDGMRFLSTAILCFLLITIQQNLSSQTCPNPFSLGADTMICAGSSLQIAPDAVLNNPLSISWSNQASLSVAANGLSATAVPMVTTTYWLDVRSLTGPQLVNNGDFSQGDTGFSSDYTFGNSTGGNGPLDGEGQYRVTNSPTSVHDNYANCGDQTTGSGNMMVVNGADSPVNVWCQTISVVPNETYAFSAYVASMISENPAVLQFRINGTLLGSPFAASSATCLWTEFFELWPSGTTSSAEICISNQNTIDAGNDFAIDDISFRRTCLNTDSITVAPVSTPAITFDIPASICANTASIPLAQFLTGASPTDGEWTLNNSPISGTLNPASLTPGNYTLAYTAGLADCPVSNSQSFTLIAAPEAGNFQVNEVAFCRVDLIGTGVDLANLLANADPNGSWSFTPTPTGISLNNFGQLNTLADLDFTGPLTITYTVNSASGCGSDEANFIVNINPSPAFDQSNTSFSLPCDQTGITIDPVTQLQAGFRYTWFRDGLSIANGSELNITQAGVYTLVGEHLSSGCQDSIVINMAANQSIGTLSVLIDPFRCGTNNSLLGGSVAITEVPNGTPPFTFFLDDGTVQMDSVFQNISPGLHQIAVEDAAGCSATTTFDLVDPRDYVFQLTTSGSTQIEYGEGLSVSVQSSLPASELDSLFWIPLGYAPLGSTQIFADSDSSLIYIATVHTSAGCTFTDSLLLEPQLGNIIYTPNAFSPNGDGVNDNWIPFAHPVVNAIQNLQIFDRWGGIVHTQDNLPINQPNQGWDGKKQGKEVPIGSYAWTLEVELFNGEIRRFSGQVMVLR